MSIPRLLNIFALVIFVVFIATFFSVLVRLSRVGIMTERSAMVSEEPVKGEPPVTTWFDLIGQDKETGTMNFNVRARFDIKAPPFNNLSPGDTILLRIENLQPELRRYHNLVRVFANPASEQYVIVDFGELQLDTTDHRDFYPFDGYELSYSFAYFVPSKTPTPTAGSWFLPKMAIMKSMTNLIFLNPRFTLILPDMWGVRTRIARLRMLQFLTATLILIEILFAIYLVTITDLQELLAKGLGYLVVLYIIRNVLTSGAPQFPTLIDYGTLFLVCGTFFIMLFKFLSGAEERSILTMPPSWRVLFMSSREETGATDDSAQSEDEA